MKRLIILTALIASSGAVAMQEGDGPCRKLCTTPKNDGSLDDHVYVNDRSGGKIIETYDSYIYALEKTALEDDVLLHISIPRPLFFQLCVQASKAHALDKNPFKELLQKLKSNAIHHNEATIKLTKRDTFHRLLSYIPCGKVHALVNDKKVKINIMVALHEPAEPIQQGTEFGDFPGPDVIKSCRGQDLKPSGEKRLTVNFDFEKDTEHHAKVVAAFAELIARSNQ